MLYYKVCLVISTSKRTIYEKRIKTTCKYDSTINLYIMRAMRSHYFSTFTTCLSIEIGGTVFQRIRLNRPAAAAALLLVAFLPCVNVALFICLTAFAGSAAIMSSSETYCRVTSPSTLLSLGPADCLGSLSCRDVMAKGALKGTTARSHQSNKRKYIVMHRLYKAITGPAYHSLCPLSF